MMSFRAKNMYSQTWLNEHLHKANIWPLFWGQILSFYNNDHMSTTATIFGSQEWSLHTSLVLGLKFLSHYSSDPIMRPSYEIFFFSTVSQRWGKSWARCGTPWRRRRRRATGNGLVISASKSWENTTRKWEHFSSPVEVIKSNFKWHYFVSFLVQK